MRTQTRTNQPNDDDSNQDTDEEVVDDYYENFLAALDQGMLPHEFDGSRRKKQVLELSQVSEASRPSTADTAKYTDTRTDTPTAPTRREPIFEEIKRRQQAGENVSMSDLFGEAEVNDLWNLPEGFFEVGRTDGTESVAGERQRETTKPLQDESSQDDPSPFDVYSNYPNLEYIALDALDVDSGNDDDVLLAMFMKLCGGREYVLEYVAKHWPKYQQRIFKEREEAKRREQERITAERKKAERARQGANKDPDEIIRK